MQQPLHDGARNTVISLIVQKLRHGVQLTSADEAILADLSMTVRRVERGDIQWEGIEPQSIILLLEGWACRFKQLENGKRQITSVYVSGDLCEPFGAVPPFLDHSLAALTACMLGFVAPSSMRAAAQASQRIEQALWWDLMLSQALGREHVVSLGRRSAMERLGFFFFEMHARKPMMLDADSDRIEELERDNRRLRRLLDQHSALGELTSYRGHTTWLE